MKRRALAVLIPFSIMLEVILLSNLGCGVIKYPEDTFYQESAFTRTPHAQANAVFSLAVASGRDGSSPPIAASQPTVTSPLKATPQPTITSTLTPKPGSVSLMGAASRLNSQLVDSSLPNDTRRLSTSAQSMITPTLAPTRTPTHTPTATSISFIEMLVRTSTPSISFLNLPMSELDAFVYAPEIPMEQPIVLITVFGTETKRSTIEIRGKINQVEFVCLGTHCELPVTEDSVIVFKAYSSSGITSEQIMATIRVDELNGRYVVTIGAYMPPIVFVDTCAEIWGASGSSYLDWARFPQAPNQLNTKRILHYLASQLIISGVVDASDCPGGGLIDMVPNACGLERASNAMISWQNRFDLDIWLSGKDNGIPPILLKQLIEYESQFWPRSTRFFLYEYGLAQVNQLGTDVALRWDRDLYNDVCRSVLADCHLSYYMNSESSRSMVRGALTSMLNADCPECAYGLDLDKAHQSVWLIARIMRSNCLDAKYLLGEYGYSAAYEDYWKFTLVSYHSGSWCLQNAVRSIARPGSKISWAQVSPRLDCPGAREYVDEFWASLVTFRDNLLQPGEFEVGWVVPTLLPTPTPLPSPTSTPSPTPVLSDAKIRVRVFMDINANGLQDEFEGLDGIPVRLTLESGVVLSSTTVDGETVFDMTGYPVGTSGIVSLPGLYRSSRIVLPLHGEKQVDFMFTEPLLPTDLP